MRYASVCSGVEAASLAWMPLGWKPVWFSEIEPFPCEVLKQRFPGVPNLGDMTKIDGEKYAGTVDLLVGGTPCQGFSVAGKQGGLGDPRSALCLAYCRLLETMRPRWFVWENVPGVFSTNGGKDFKAFLRAIDEIGYSCAWRVLDAQYIRVDGYPRAVPQRRRRVFVVGYLGEWRYPASVLFEPGCLHRDTPPRREAGEETPGGAGRGAQAAGFRAMSIGNGQAGELGCANDSVAQTRHCMHDQQAVLCYENHAQDSRIREIDCAPVLSAKAGAGGKPLNALGIDGYNGAISGSVSATVDTRCKNANGPTLVMAHGQANAEISEAVSPALTCDHETPIAFRWAASPSQGLSVGVDYCHTLMANRSGEPAACQYGEIAGTLVARHDSSPCADRGMNIVTYENHAQDSRAGGIAFSESAAPTLKAARSGSNQVPDVLQSATVRRLLPVETERLMGFPDDWTRIQWRGKPAEECPDSPRYKACGNSMCVNVMRWIGMRIENVERKMK